MLSKIDSLDDLQEEKIRLRKQIEIVQGELNSSAGRTRITFNDFLEQKLSLPKQLGQLLQGGAKQAAGSSAVGALGRAAGLGNWWSGLISAFAPVLMNFIRKQVQRRKERQLTVVAEVPEAPKEKKPKRRKLFKRKSAKTETETENNTKK